ncbi:unnamed protein product [Acanthoscelides obtectus]|uniref:BLUF domain-containing protein n=1 Tax=Acanthoscelides obtectus TaxID=200917 RepID=A0A9P0PB02_ACAOB|nr:unnamed protein product [Acanthoscelides obtectus]CAK1645772.1 hypothetical protein AOBTE_LOCUS14259 [Acanthoscelides obtectus]
MDNKTVNVKYPKLRDQKTKKLEHDLVQEPARKTLFDRIMANFKMMERRTYLHRIIYVGEHDIASDLPSMLVNTVTAVNEAENTVEKLTGFLLVYQKCFLHMVEGSEDSITKHVGLVLNKYGDNKELKNLKLLIQVSHILKRVCPEWQTYFGVPSKLLSPLEEEASMEETGRRLYTCVRCIYNLLGAFAKDAAEASEMESIKDIGGSKSSLSLRGSLGHRLSIANNSRNLINKGSHSSSLNRSQSILGHSKDRYWQHLPEYEVIIALIRSPYVQTLQSFYDVYMVVPQRDIYKDKVWPVPGDFIPFDVFSELYDCTTELRAHRGVTTTDQDQNTEEADDASEKESDED